MREKLRKFTVALALLAALYPGSQVTAQEIPRAFSEHDLKAHSYEECVAVVIARAKSLVDYEAELVRAVGRKNGGITKADLEFQKAATAVVIRGAARDKQACRLAFPEQPH